MRFMRKNHFNELAGLAHQQYLAAEAAGKHADYDLLPYTVIFEAITEHGAAVVKAHRWGETIRVAIKIEQDTPFFYNFGEC